MYIGMSLGTNFNDRDSLHLEIKKSLTATQHRNLVLAGKRFKKWLEIKENCVGQVDDDVVHFDLRREVINLTVVIKTEKNKFSL